MYRLGQEQKAYPTIIDALLLQSRLALVNIDIKKAQLLLDQARILADEKDLSGLIGKIETEQSNLAAQFLKWKYLIDSAKLHGEEEQTNMEAYFAEILKLK